MKKLLTITICLLAAVFIVFGIPYIDGTLFQDNKIESDEVGVFHQKIVERNETPVTNYFLYNQGEVLAVVNDKAKLDRFLNDIYKNEFQEDYPDSDVNLAVDVVISEENSNFIYEDKDDEILDYIKENQLYSLQATAVTFADENDVYAKIYVANKEIYENAMNTFISYFIDEKDLTSVLNGDEPPTLTTYGSQDVAISIPQKITLYKDYISENEIYKTEEEVLDFLKYGTNKEREYYTVKQYDTVAGIGSKNHGLSAQQVMNINRDKISNVNQALNEGDELCVTYFTSPIDIIVTSEALRNEPIYYATNYVEDNDLLIDTREVSQGGKNGSRNVLYTEMWINGVLMSGTEENSVVLEDATPEIIKVGVMEKPDIGTGDYRVPVNNAAISCPWGCYYNHQGTDFINQYDPYGEVYAADNGVVEENAYQAINGNYMIINHNNGYKSYYGHMAVLSDLPVGTVVQKGDVIGQIGMTGLATGPHVHFHIIDEDGTWLNACEGFIDCRSYLQ